VSRRPLVYAAHPMTSYGTPHERRALAAIRAALPRTRVIDPSIHYASARQWLEEWPSLATQLSSLVVFGDETSAIGAGFVREVADALCLDLPIAVLVGAELCELRSLRLLPASRRSRARTAVPVAGSAITPEVLVPNHSTKGASRGRAR
jgi:hypothetical protein